MLQACSCAALQWDSIYTYVYCARNFSHTWHSELQSHGTRGANIMLKNYDYYIIPRLWFVISWALEAAHTHTCSQAGESGRRNENMGWCLGPEIICCILPLGGNDSWLNLLLTPCEWATKHCTPSPLPWCHGLPKSPPWQGSWAAQHSRQLTNEKIHIPAPTFLSWWVRVTKPERHCNYSSQIHCKLIFREISDICSTHITRFQFMPVLWNEVSALSLTQKQQSLLWPLNEPTFSFCLFRKIPQKMQIYVLNIYSTEWYV